MRQKDKLFELIQSMSMSEKRYFKIFSGRHVIGEKSHTLIMFTILAALKKYESEVAIAQLKAQGISTTHYASDKNYLYRLILRSLSNFHRDKTSSLKVKNLLIEIEILYNRGLYAQCLPLIKKGANLCKAYELYPQSIELLHLERKVTAHLRKLGQFKESLDLLQNRLYALENLNKFMLSYGEILSYRAKKGIVRTEEEAQELEDIMQVQGPLERKDAHSFLAKHYYWRIRANYHYLKYEEKEELRANREIETLLMQNGSFASEYRDELISVKSRILNLARKFEPEVFDDLLQEFLQLNKQPSVFGAKYEARVCTAARSTEVAFYIDQQNIAQARAGLDQMKALEKKFEDHFSESLRITFYYIYGYVHTLTGELSEALHYINYIINQSNEQVRPEIHVFTRILNLVLHFEMGNRSYLKYLADTAIRYVKKHKRMYSWEKFALGLFKGIASINDDQQLLERFEKAIQALREIEAEPYQGVVNNYLNLGNWLQNKVEALASA